MTDKAALLALADKLERATGPSKELDALIGNALGFVPFDMCTDLLGNPFGSPEDAFPEFTRSVDAALILRPDGWLLTGLSDGIIDMKYRDVRSLTKWLTGMARLGAVVNGPEDVGEMVSSMGANPSLSVAAAALRARAA